MPSFPAAELYIIFSSLCFKTFKYGYSLVSGSCMVLPLWQPRAYGVTSVLSGPWSTNMGPHCPCPASPGASPPPYPWLRTPLRSLPQRRHGKLVSSSATAWPDRHADILAWPRPVSVPEALPGHREAVSDPGSLHQAWTWPPLMEVRPGLALSRPNPREVSDGWGCPQASLVPGWGGRTGPGGQALPCQPRGPPLLRGFAVPWRMRPPVFQPPL